MARLRQRAVALEFVTHSRIVADLKEAVRKELLFLEFKGKTIVLKAEQEKALYSLLEGNDVLAILPTGFGKSMIFTMFSVAARERTPEAVSVWVISPLISIITDQIADLEGLSEAAELKADNLTAILKDPPHFIFASAEKVLEERFLRALKDPRFHFGTSQAHIIDCRRRVTHGGNVDGKKVFLCTHFSS